MSKDQRRIRADVLARSVRDYPHRQGQAECLACLDSGRTTDSRYQGGPALFVDAPGPVYPCACVVRVGGDPLAPIPSPPDQTRPVVMSAAEVEALDLLRAKVFELVGAVGTVLWRAAPRGTLTVDAIVDQVYALMGWYVEGDRESLERVDVEVRPVTVDNRVIGAWSSSWSEHCERWTSDGALAVWQLLGGVFGRYVAPSPSPVPSCCAYHASGGYATASCGGDVMRVDARGGATMPAPSTGRGFRFDPDQAPYRRVLRAAEARGLLIEVNDGEDVTVHRAASAAIEAVEAVDYSDVRFWVETPGQQSRGWVRVMLDTDDPEDTVSDYSVPPEGREDGHPCRWVGEVVEGGAGS